MASGGLEKIADVTDPLMTAARTVEDGLSMVVGNLLTLMLGMLIGLGATEPARWSSTASQVTYGGLALGWVVLDLPYLVLLWRVAFRGKRPWAFETANRRWMAPLALRPLIALWWFAHFAFGVHTALTTPALVKDSDPWIVLGINFLLTTSYGFAANGYLMLAVCALTRSPTARLAVWRRRGLIDVALGVAGALLPTALLK
jgi:hypothetical protein